MDPCNPLSRRHFMCSVFSGGGKNLQKLTFGLLHHKVLLVKSISIEFQSSSKDIISTGRFDWFKASYTRIAQVPT
jgi:hypothetical protein